eukprot:COSAG02_NODE_475_length_21552_cov_4.236470_4_plen_94_part_00
MPVLSSCASGRTAAAIAFRDTVQGGVASARVSSAGPRCSGLQIGHSRGLFAKLRHSGAVPAHKVEHEECERTDCGREEEQAQKARFVPGSESL